MTRRAKAFGLGVGLVLGLVCAGSLLAGCSTPAKPAGCPVLVVPTYSLAGNDPRWAGLAAEGTDVGWVIFNPDNGPGTAPDPAFVRAAKLARRGGANVLGYVPTEEGRHGLPVAAELACYRRWYGIVDIFFDEVPSAPAAEGVYRRDVALVHAHGGLAVLNPGDVPARGYFSFADAVVTFEDSPDHLGSNPPSPPAAWHVPARKVWNIIYSAPEGRLRRLVAGAVRRHIGALYITDRRPPDPYDGFPAFLATERRELTAACAAAGSATPRAIPREQRPRTSPT